MADYFQGERKQTSYDIQRLACLFPPKLIITTDVTDNENLQFITVTARNGSVFYFVIDKGANSENVHFLNTVDESDLAALVEDDTSTAATAEQQKPEASASPEPEQTHQKPQEQKKGNSTMLYIVLALIAAGVIGGYYYKVILPKKTAFICGRHKGFRAGGNRKRGNF